MKKEQFEYFKELVEHLDVMDKDYNMSYAHYLCHLLISGVLTEENVSEESDMYLNWKLM